MGGIYVASKTKMDVVDDADDTGLLTRWLRWWLRTASALSA
jgi:hypothetical protein